jgi:hypothetical protein
VRHEPAERGPGARRVQRTFAPESAQGDAHSTRVAHNVTITGSASRMRCLSAVSAASTRSG